MERPGLIEYKGDVMKKIAIILLITIIILSMLTGCSKQMTDEHMREEQGLEKAFNTAQVKETGVSSTYQAATQPSSTQQPQSTLAILDFENNNDILKGIDDVYYNFIKDNISGVVFTDEQKDTIMLGIEVKGISEDQLVEAAKENLSHVISLENGQAIAPAVISVDDITQTEMGSIIYYTFKPDELPDIILPEDYYMRLESELPHMSKTAAIDSLLFGYNDTFPNLTLLVLYTDVSEETAMQYLDELCVIKIMSMMRKI
jgi:uncharacterized protein YpmB